MVGRVNPCGIMTVPANPMDASDHTQRITVGAQPLVRALAGVMIEIGLSRHANLFFGVDRVIGDNANFQQQRAYYQILWFGLDPFTYPHLGITYKF